MAESFIYKLSTRSPLKFYHRKQYNKNKILSVESGREKIVELVNSGKPFMAARYGTSEGRALMEYHKIKMGLQKKYSRIARKELCCNAGFFPDNSKCIDKWGELLSCLSSECDIYGVMNFTCEGWAVKNLLPEDVVLMPNSGIASGACGYIHCLENKKVLVVYPMTNTIEKQYKKRELLFPDTNALPEFELITYKAINTQADEVDERFNTWFDALDYMSDEISKIDFDVAIIGCGAYGFPLAARIKQMGKQAIHMGGAVQHLFGIKSARGCSNPSINKDYNEHWVYPDESDRPKGSEKIEGGCYWAPIEK